MLPPAARYTGEQPAVPPSRRYSGEQPAVPPSRRYSGEQPAVPPSRRYSGEQPAVPPSRRYSGATRAVPPSARYPAGEPVGPPPGSYTGETVALPMRGAPAGPVVPSVVGPDPYVPDPYVDAGEPLGADPLLTAPLSVTDMPEPYDPRPDPYDGLPGPDDGSLDPEGLLPGPAADVRTGPGSPAWPGEATYGVRTYTNESYADDSYEDADAEYDDFGDDDLDDLPKRRGCRNAVIVLGVLVVMAMVTTWFAWSWVQDKIDPPGGQGDEVLVTIPEGTSTAGIGDVLADAGVISDARVWGWYTRLRSVPSIQAGNYRMQLDSSFTEAIDDLEEGALPPEVERLVTIPEGLTQQQIAERLADPENGVPGFTPEGVAQALQDPALRSAVLPAGQASLEGTLYPETYAVEEGDSEATVLQRMVAKFDEVALEIELAARAAEIGRTPYEVLIVASMVEREAGIPADAPRVARVIYNRLAAGEPLGIDATSCYEKGQIPCELTTAELEDNTPYDTRQRAGLVPTPIASPGRASIEAALAPADGPWMWYVLDVEVDDGSSFFTDDYDEFLAAKDRCEAAGRCG
jgi:UPF0755 protein